MHPTSFSVRQNPQRRPGRLTDSAARTDVVLLIRRTVRPGGYASVVVDCLFEQPVRPQSNPHPDRPQWMGLSRLRLRVSSEGLLIPPTSLRGNRQIVLHCAHRATTALSWGLCEQEERSACSLHPSEAARSASNEGTQSHPNLFFSNSFTFPGFAFPPLAFITCPTRNPSTCCLPSLNWATCVGFLVSTSSIILPSAPSSDT
jgi:hypothetical protein